MGWFNVRELKLTVDQEEASRKLLRQLDRLYATAVQLETGQRGYLLARDERYLSPYREALGRKDAELDELAALAQRYGVSADLDIIHGLLEEREAGLDRLITLQREEGFDEALLAIQGGEGRETMEALRKSLDEVADEVESDLEDRGKEVERSYQVAQAVQVAGGLLAIAFLGTLILVLGRSLRTERRDALLQELHRRRLERVASVSTTIHSANTESSVVGVLAEESRRVLEARDVEVLIGEAGPEVPEGSLATPFFDRSGEVLGHLRAAPRRGESFGAIDHAIARQLANMATVAFDNSRLYEELRESGHRKDEFLATLAHELRNPLAAIGNALLLLEREPSASQSTRRCSEIISRQHHQLTRLVGDLMDISRISRGKLLLQRKSVHLREVLDAAIEATQPTIAANDQKLVVQVPDEAIELFVDSERVSQVVLNLLTNSARYTDSGGTIELFASLDEGLDEIQIRVRDNGIGITRSSLGKIFEVFRQAERPEGQAASGLGVGLALVRQIVEMHGGRVTAHSAGVGKGSEFLVCLPRGAAPDRETDAGSVAPPEPTQGQLRILAADDNRDAADTLADLLRMDGHEVSAVYDGEAAVEIATTFRPDLVFLDIGLPGISGYDAARALRRLPFGNDMTLVALTGWGQDEDRRRSTEAGFDRHLVKPMAPDMLDQVLEQAMKAKSGDGGPR